MKCKLCGYNFDEKKADTICRDCVLSNNCLLIRCPNCNFENPQENEKDRKSLPVTRMKNNEKGIIANICTYETEQLKKIVSMGIMPGMMITLIRKYPTILCQIGYSQFALDSEIAKYIVVILE